MNLARFSVISMAAAMSLAACGNQRDASSNRLSDSSGLNQHEGAEALLHFRLIEGDFNPPGDSLECLALRGKMFAKRTLIKTSNEWGAIKQTNEFKALEANENKFNDLGCKPENPDATQPCKDLQNQLLTDAATLSKTPQWNTLGNNADWTDLQTDYGKAAQLKCL